jgi:hypothetical protein
MANHVSFHRVEEIYNRSESEDVLLSFGTRQYGYYQIHLEKDLSNDEYELNELFNEPDLMMFTRSERYYIRCVCRLVHRMIFDSGKPQVLSEYSSY